MSADLMTEIKDLEEAHGTYAEQQYAALVAKIADGESQDAEASLEILRDCGRTSVDLDRDVAALQERRKMQARIRDGEQAKREMQSLQADLEAHNREAAVRAQRDGARSKELALKIGDCNRRIMKAHGSQQRLLAGAKADPRQAAIAEELRLVAAEQRQLKADIGAAESHHRTLESHVALAEQSLKHCDPSQKATLQKQRDDDRGTAAGHAREIEVLRERLTRLEADSARLRAESERLTAESVRT